MEYSSRTRTIFIPLEVLLELVDRLPNGASSILSTCSTVHRVPAALFVVALALSIVDITDVCAKEEVDLVDRIRKRPIIRDTRVYVLHTHYHKSKPDVFKITPTHIDHYYFKNKQLPADGPNRSRYKICESSEQL